MRNGTGPNAGSVTPDSNSGTGNPKRRHTDAEKRHAESENRHTDAEKRHTARQRLLAAAIASVAAHGIHDRSLRELAVTIGTSHRMLIYHFGSRAGLLRAIVEDVEEQQRSFFTSFAADPSVPAPEVALAMWRQLIDPSLEQNERLFFELYVQALYAQPGTSGFLDGIVEAWLEPATDYGVRRGLSPEAARADARLGLAIVRGLLLDLVATGDRPGVDSAFNRYIELYQTWSGAPLTTDFPRRESVAG
jgi:AcrR family transcriptional regulator